MGIQEDLKLLKNPRNTKFKDALNIAKKYFGEPRIKGSHHIFKTPWLSDTRVNIQPLPRDKKMAKAYQVIELVKALKRLEEEK